MSTQTTTNPSQMAQQPYLNFGYGEAQNLYNNNPQSYYPGQTLAQNPMQQGGYENIYNAGQVMQQNYLPLAQDAYSQMPDYANMLAQFGMAGANNPALNSLLSTAQGQGVGMEQLAKTAQGAYLNSNPYMDQMVQSAIDPVTRNYQTSIAPTMDAALSQSGRYGSGAQAGLYDTSQQNLAKATGDISSGLYGQQYAKERQLQDAAAQMYGQIANQAGSSAGQIYNQGLNTGIGGLQAGANANAQMLSLFPQLYGAQATGAQAQLQAGQGLAGLSQQQIQDEMARYYGTQQAPWKGLEQYMGVIGSGNPVPGSGTTKTPYYSNPIAGVGSLLSGAAGMGGKLGKN